MPNGVSGIHRLAQQKYMAQTKIYGPPPTASVPSKSNLAPETAQEQEPSSTASLSPTQLYQQADQMVEESRLKEARDLYQGIVKQYPNEAKAHFQIGYISSQLGDHNLVVPHYLKAVSQKTDYFEEAHIVLGQAYLNSKHYARAINEFKTVLTKNPQNRDVRVFYDIASFSLVLSKNPNSAEAHNGLGYAYYQRKDYSKALAEYLKAVKLNPNYSSAYFNLGVLYFNVGRFSDAKVHYLKAVELDPGHANYHFGLGLAYYKLEEHRRAHKEWKQTIKLDPDHLEARRALEEY